MWTNVDQWQAPQNQERMWRVPAPSGSRPAPKDVDYSAQWTGAQNATRHTECQLARCDGGFDTPLTRESAAQKFNRDEIEERVEVIGHGAPVSATLARRLTEFARGSSRCRWATQTLGFG